jgi:hypothetical protein
LSIGGHRWLRLLLLSVVLYLALLPVWWYGLGVLASVIAACADFVYNFFDPQVSIRASGRLITASVTASEASGFGGQIHSSTLRLDTVTYGMPMVAALVLVTRADSISARLRALVLGLASIIAITIPVVMMWAKIASLELEDKIAQATMTGPGDSSGAFLYVFHGYAFSQPVVAVVIWMGLMMFGVFKSKPKPEAIAVGQARNAPCPCGSGRKYKRCCGRA